MLVLVKRVYSQVVDIPTNDLEEAKQIAYDAAVGMPEEDFTLTYEIKALPVVEKQLTFSEMED